VILTEDRVAAAEALAQAERDRAPVDPLTQKWPDLEVADAYEIQSINIRARSTRGGVVRGHKVGLTARAMQDMLGVNEPDYGQLLDDMLLEDGSTLEMAELCQPKAEIEVAFVLDSPLTGPGVTVPDVLRATAFVMPALEIIDSRIRDWQITLSDTIADNASSARVVLGAKASRLDGLDPRLLGCTIRRNGEIVETGASGAALGNPAKAVAWLANKLAQFGESLQEGQIVMPGACTRAIDVSAGDHLIGEFDALGSVSVGFV
jgi:2-keto-4-pentenoate hydratase